jgi:transmembrane sensor
MREPRPSRSEATSLALPLRQHLQSGVDEAAAQRMWQGIERRLDAPGHLSRPGQRAWHTRQRASHTRQRARGLLAASAAALLAGTLLVMAALLPAPPGLVRARFALSEQLRGPRALVLMNGARFASLEGGEHEPRSVSLVDGSRIEAAAGARVEVLTSTASELVLVVRRGRVRFSVTPGGPRRWSIEARGTRVEVVGTILSVESGERAVSVAVEVGAVLVRSAQLANGLQRLGAGQSLELAAAPPEGERLDPIAGSPVAAASGDAVSSRASSEALAPEPDLPIAPRPREPVTPEPDLPVAPASSERASGDAPAVVGAAANVSPERSSSRQRPSRERQVERASELWSQADAARAAGDARTAARVLERLVRRHPSDPRAALAAFTLGAVLADELQRPEQAALAFRRAIDLGLSALLRDTGYLRLATALSAAQDGPGLRALVVEYVAAYPEGEQRSMLETLARQAERAGAGTPPAPRDK